MADSLEAYSSARYRMTFDLSLKLIDDLTDAQLLKRVGPNAPSIGFHLWHMSRWADLLHQLINWPVKQLWESEDLAAKWGFDPSVLGHQSTGTGLGRRGHLVRGQADGHHP